MANILIGDSIQMANGKWQTANILRVSVVIPCYNAGDNLSVCLDALLNQTVQPYEIIVVDDVSTDDSVRIAGEREGVKVVQLPFNSGAAAARNAGAARTKGDIILFVDADVALKPDAVERSIEKFSAPDSPDAVVGMYSKRPPTDNFYSIAHNYFTYYNHARQEGAIQWFWGAIGAVKKDAFNDVGGFDQRRYHGASAEDIELGFRLSRAGYRIVIDHSIVGNHLVRFNLWKVIYNDFRKSVLGAKLFLEENRNLDHKHGFASSANGAAVALAGFIVMGVLAWAAGWAPMTVVFVLLVGFYIASLPYLRFISSEEGNVFTVKVALLHLVSFIAIAFGVFVGALWHASR